MRSTASASAGERSMRLRARESSWRRIFSAPSRSSLMSGTTWSVLTQPINSSTPGPIMDSPASAASRRPSALRSTTACRSSMSYTNVRPRVCTVGSTSRGTAMSTKNRGSVLCSSAAATTSRPTTHSPDPVELTTTSARCSSEGRSSNPTAVPPIRSASLRARSGVRLAMARSATPLPLSCLTTSSLMSPAPTTRARRPRREPKTPSASLTATCGTERELSPTPVRVRTSFPTRREVWKSRFRTGPVQRSSVAER